MTKFMTQHETDFTLLCIFQELILISFKDVKLIQPQDLYLLKMLS